MTDLNYCVIDLNDFIEETEEIDLIIRRARYKRTLPVKGEEVILLEEDKVLKQ